jgi:hypothetical protein
MASTWNQVPAGSTRRGAVGSPNRDAMARMSTTVDPEEPDGIWEATMLHNEEVYAVYAQDTQNNRNRWEGPG